MTRRTKIIIGVIVALLLLLLLALYFLLPRGEGTITEGLGGVFGNPPPAGGLINTTTGSIVNRSTSQPSENVNAVETAAPPPDERSNLKRTAAAFAERFGSFSNQSDYENILELKVLMTAKMQAWADTYVEQQRKRPASAVFFGTTTRAVSATVTDFDEAQGTATVTVSTQRSESSGETAETKVYYQDIVITFIQEGTVWKVDSAIWQPR